MLCLVSSRVPVLLVSIVHWKLFHCEKHCNVTTVLRIRIILMRIRIQIMLVTLMGNRILLVTLMGIMPDQPDHACHFDADPDPTFLFGVDPDVASK
jgi:hypothetical protein